MISREIGNGLNPWFGPFPLDHDGAGEVAGAMLGTYAGVDMDEEAEESRIGR